MRRGGGRRASGGCGGASRTRARRRGRRSATSAATGQSGRAPSEKPTISMAARTSARAAPIAANAPPVRRTRSSPGSVREKRPTRITSPSRAGATELTSEPTPYRAPASSGPERPPTAASAERHASAEPASEPTKPSAASQSQIGCAASSWWSAAVTSEPSSPGSVATTIRARGERPGERRSSVGRRVQADREAMRSCAHSDSAPMRLLATPHFPYSAFRVLDMRGAIAAGHPLTAEVGAQVLAEGGNAVDACIAAGFASWVAESPLTGAGGGGFMLDPPRARPLDARARLLHRDARARPRGTAGARRWTRWTSTSRATRTRSSRSARPRCAVPGTTLGLETAHRAFGTLPWARARRARRRAGAARLRADPAAGLPARDPRPDPPSLGRGAEDLRQRRASGSSPGDTLRLPDLAGTLDLIAEQGAAAVYGGELGRALVRGRARGRRHAHRGRPGRVPRDPPASRSRSPYAGHEFLSNPPPSGGGVLIAYGLEAARPARPGGPPGSAEAIAGARDGDARAAPCARGVRAPALATGRLPRRTCSRIGSSAASRSRRGRRTSRSSTRTGNAAALTVSTGSGSGVFAPGTGVALNNMLGEFDLPGRCRAR